MKLTWDEQVGVDVSLESTSDGGTLSSAERGHHDVGIAEAHQHDRARDEAEGRLQGQGWQRPDEDEGQGHGRVADDGHHWRIADLVAQLQYNNL